MKSNHHVFFTISLCLLSSFLIANSTTEKGLPVSCSEVETGQAWVEGAEFVMGDDNAYREEGPAHKVSVSSFWMDVHEVTNAQFEQFVQATGYITVAEKKPSGTDWGTSDVPPEFLQAGSVLFVPPASGQSMANWWSWVPGTSWRHPEGPDSNLSGKADFPVIHIAFADAQAYAEWAGRSLPTEAQFELAARNKRNTRYPWDGNELAPGGHHHANTWQGSFPVEHRSEDGHTCLAPVGCYPSN